MAEVSADNISLSYSGPNPYVSIISKTVLDLTGNNDGHLDPGETADLTVTLKNIGGVNFSTLTATLVSDDPDVSVTDNSAIYGVIAIDSSKTNSSDPFTVVCSSSAQEGREALLKLILRDGSYCDTMPLTLTIGMYDYLVLNTDPTPVSGFIIDSVLSTLGYSGVYTVELPSDLSYFKSLFICLGVWPDNTIIQPGSDYETALVNFINSGGNVFMEGGDVWFNDPLAGGCNFGPLFGIQSSGEASNNLGPVYGISGAFTAGMNFGYAGESNFIDCLNPVGNGFRILRDPNDNYNCGVANQTADYKTVGMSCELGMLTDYSGVSTRSALLDSIMRFFGEEANSAEEIPIKTGPVNPISAFPNPFTERILITFTAPTNVISRAEIFDISGRTVREFTFGASGVDRLVTIEWNGKDEQGNGLPRGVYFVKVSAGENSDQEKMIFVE